MAPLRTNEAARAALDTLDKWQKVVMETWANLHRRLNATGIKQGGVLKFGDVILDVTLEKPIVRPAHMARGGIHLVNAVLEGTLDVSSLPEIRRHIYEMFASFEKNIADAKAAEAQALLEKERKINEVLPKIIDEFGADVLTFVKAADDKIVEAGSPPYPKNTGHFPPATIGVPGQPTPGQALPIRGKNG